MEKIFGIRFEDNGSPHHQGGSDASTYKHIINFQQVTITRKTSNIRTRCCKRINLPYTP